MKIFMDESGNGNPSQPLIVGGIELGDNADAIEEQIRDLHRRLCVRGSFIGHPQFDDFHKNGFHSSTDPLDVSVPFRELIRSLLFRAYMVVTDRSGVPGAAELERIEVMYEKLLGDLLLRHRDESELICFIEQSEGMESVICRLPDRAAARAYGTLGRLTSLPRLEITMVTKGEYLSTAIADYVMAAVSRWIKAGCPTSAIKWEYRGFREIEPFISILYSFELGRISSRKDPLH
jgi:hypothetical protein